MNIAHILPHGAVFPLQKHNGRYEWALRLARLQAARGHQVTIFSGTTLCDAIPELQWRSVDKKETRLETNSALFEAALGDDSFDVYHSHFDSLHSVVPNPHRKPIICTQHWFPTEKIAQDARQDTTGAIVYVPVTELMRKEDVRLGIPCTSVIYHGIDTTLFHPHGQVTDRLLFVGRIAQGKGVKEAVEIAFKASVPLDIYGKINDVDRAYYESFSHLIDGTRIVYHGPKPLEEIADAMAGARALLFPSQHAEAFGQVTIESQASGAPVVISNIGASSELVINNRTGFVVDDGPEEYIDAIGRIDAIDRKECRHHAEKFTIEKMYNEYIALYESLRRK